MRLKENVMKKIGASVGVWEKGAKNHYQDVVTIQTMLENAAKETENSAFDPKGVDGKISKLPGKSNTVKAIWAFQKTFMVNPDALVEPNKNTFNKLASYTPDQPGKVPSNVPESPIINVSGYNFPLGFVPNYDYHTGGRRFGASRSGGTRKHAGCDLISPEGTKIYAVYDGTVSRGPYYFYHGTYAVEVDHGGFVARYSEIKGMASGLRVGSQVSAGQLLAYVGKMYTSSMLHFELYQGTASGGLTQRNHPPYQRRSDLLDPTPYLDMWKTRLPG
jgi:murein DD-endopeptidase MepM/ murein hydrolase activator NlpD